jgi:MoxR-like ATPase
MKAAKAEQGIKPGQIFEAVFFLNTKSESPFRFRATHLDGQRAPKVVLCNDPRITPGQLFRVKVTSVSKPSSKDRGFIEVEFLGLVTFRLDDSMYVDPVLSLKLQALLESGMNILLDGPQGSGKTTLSRKVAEALDMQYVFFNCSSVFEATDFLAVLQLRSTPKGQVETAWIPTDILRALEDAHAHPEKRYLIFLDEFNRCREMARNGIMPALDATRKMYNPLTGSTTDIPDNTLWIAAINNGPQFTGASKVDPAQLDRFAPLKMNYPPPAQEVKLLLQKHPGLDKTTVSRVIKAADALRKDRDLGLDLSMRATDEVCVLLSHPNFAEREGDQLPELLKTSFCARFTGDWSDNATDAGMAWERIVRALKL